MEKLLVTICARDDKESELMQTSQYITEQTLQVPGCKCSSLFQDRDKGNLITLEQQWDQRSSLNDYFRSDHFTALLGAMKWLGQSFEIQINGSSGTEGLQAVQAARAKEDVNDE